MIAIYKLTSVSLKGELLITYNDGDFQSVSTTFKPCLNNASLRTILGSIPAHEADLVNTLSNVLQPGKSTLVKLGDDEVLPPNQMIALFCDRYKTKTGIRYKVSAADSGKIAALKITAGDWQKLLDAYFKSDNFLFVNKWSISNFVKYENELRLEAFGKSNKAVYPIPYSEARFRELDQNGRNAYWKALREAGYEYKHSAVDGAKWVKKEGLF